MAWFTVFVSIGICIRECDSGEKEQAKIGECLAIMNLEAAERLK